jgi:hypothetical protein
VPLTQPNGANANASIGGIDVENSRFGGNAVDVTASVNSVALAIGSAADGHIGGILIH